MSFEINKDTIILLSFIIGISIIAIGIAFGTHFIYTPDSWVPIGFANYIGRSDLSPLTDKIQYDTYPLFWSYISYGLSILTGLPLINANTMIVPLSGLSIASIYIFVKAFVPEKKSNYAYMATLFMYLMGGYIIDYTFFYKNFALFLFFIAIVLFKSNLISDKDTTDKIEKGKKAMHWKLLFLSAFFLFIAYTTYIIPFLMALIFLNILSFSSEREIRIKSFKNLTYLIGILLILFIIFDFITNFYLSESIFSKLTYYTNSTSLENLISLIPSLYMFIICLCVLLLYHFLFYFIFKKYRFNSNLLSKTRNKLNNKNFYFLIILFIIILFIVLLIGLIFDNQASNSFFFLYSYDVILGFQYVGLFCLIVFYFCLGTDFVKMNKNLIKSLISLVLVIVLLASLLIFVEWIKSSDGTLSNLSDYDLMRINVWFNRTIIYTFPPLCILGVIGVYQAKNRPIMNTNKIKTKMLKSRITLITAFVFFGILTNCNWTVGTNNNLNQEEIQTLGWISENLPYSSRILINNDYYLQTGIKSLTYCKYWFLESCFNKSLYEKPEFDQRINYLTILHIEYFLASSDFEMIYTNGTEFIENFYNITVYQNNKYTLYMHQFTV
ncbi:MAG: hypothetical protein JW891_03290 [Candidatus Lokiarchaeota archaeon]|nr:hypothetical protein [Candidatus Lokiarchaeota archaeon]